MFIYLIFKLVVLLQLVILSENDRTKFNVFINLSKCNRDMTKADLVAEIANKTGVDKAAVQEVVESFMATVKNSLLKKENVYLRGFGSFIIKERAKKTGRNISKNTTIVIPAHKIPAFKPAKSFSTTIKAKLK